MGAQLRDTEPAADISTQPYRALVEAAADVLYAVEPDTTLSALSPAFETITGWPVEAWLGRSFAGLLHPDDLPKALEFFQRTMRGEATPPHELRVSHRSGEYLWGEFLSAPKMEGGRIIGQVGVARDIAARKRAEERAELVHAILVAASGVEDLDRILVGTLERLARHVRCTGGSIALAGGDELVVHAAVGPFARTALGQRLPRGRGLSCGSWRPASRR